jgi:hypothetical protein
MVALAQAAHSAGWKVVVVTAISRSNYFVTTQAQAEFPSEQATLNQMIHSSTEFDAVADPAPQLANERKRSPDDHIFSIRSLGHLDRVAQ